MWAEEVKEQHSLFATLVRALEEDAQIPNCFSGAAEGPTDKAETVLGPSPGVNVEYLVPKQKAEILTYYILVNVYTVDHILFTASYASCLCSEAKSSFTSIFISSSHPKHKQVSYLTAMLFSLCFSEPFFMLLVFFLSNFSQVMKVGIKTETLLWFTYCINRTCHHSLHPLTLFE